jgi:hypothetical protein
MLGHAARVINVIERAAAMLRRALRHKLRKPPLVPELHSEPHDRLAALVEYCCDRGAVHAAAHGYGDSIRGGERPHRLSAWFENSFARAHRAFTIVEASGEISRSL